MSAADGPVSLDRDGPLAIISVRDEAGRNRITPPVYDGLSDALAEAATDTAARAVVLEGLPDVFCAGAPAERMLGGPHQRVTELWELVERIMSCPVPVVAAAQGHALGGGFLLALYCDAAVLSDRSRYSANFLTFGFTPILGATYLLPARLGPALAADMLYSGRSVTGRRLADRGAGVTVTRHDRVPAEARRLATRIAGSAPRDCLERLKAQLVQETRRRSREALAREIPDHEATIGSAEARRRIRLLHGQRLDETEMTA